MERVVDPEILDALPSDDPRAIRSRRDLRRINFVMGNERWIARCAVKLPAAREGGVWELGAGEGRLLARLAKRDSSLQLSGCDFLPKPAELPGWIDWHQGDALETLASADGGLLIASLFLHHFMPPDLNRLGGMLKNFEALCFAEPLRTATSLNQARMLLPFVSEVTRHDMLVSIRAGFLPGELAGLLGLGKDWDVREETTWRGGLRMLACRR